MSELNFHDRKPIGVQVKWKSHLSNAELELERLVPIDGGVELLAISLESSRVVHRQLVSVLGGFFACIRPRHMLDFQTRRSDFWNDIKIINNDVRKVYLQIYAYRFERHT